MFSVWQNFFNIQLNNCFGKIRLEQITDKPWVGKMKPACLIHFQVFPAEILLTL